MRPRPLHRLSILVLAALLALGGCGDDDDPPAVAPEAAAAAVAMCGQLRTWVNDLVEVANATTLAATARTDPIERRDRTVAGYDLLIERTVEYRDGLASFTVSGIVEAHRVVRDLQAGAAEAVEVLEDEKAEFIAALPNGITDDDLHGRMGQFLISLETANSAAEVAVATYDDPVFKRAVLDEPTCDHVVQPFLLED